jgi:hypothetical protein
MNVVAAPSPFHEAGPLQNSKMLGNGAGRDSKPVSKGANAERSLGQQVHHLYPCFHGKRAEYAHPILHRHAHGCYSIY